MLSGSDEESGGHALSQRGVGVFELEIGRERLVVVSLPGPFALPTGISMAEREVATAVLGGMSTVEIARQRGTAPRTVANQLASLYRKVGVNSRSELVSCLVDGNKNGNA